MSEFGLIRPFMVDDGQLDHLTPQEIFVLGYELSTVDDKINKNEPFSLMVSVENQKRIEWLLDNYNKSYKWRFSHLDISESWVNLIVE